MIVNLFFLFFIFLLMIGDINKGKNYLRKGNKNWGINLYFIQFINGVTVAFNMKNHKIIVMDYRKSVANTQYKLASYKITLIINTIYQTNHWWM